MNADDKIRQWIILSLMCNFVLDFAELDRRFGIDYFEYFRDENSDLETFISDSLLERDDRQIKILPEGRIFVRNVAMVFDVYLRKKAGDKAPLFSRTI